MSESIDLYCERLDASFWSEPVNALSNIAFILAALLAVKLWKNSPKTKDGEALVILTFLVGIGSFIFHTFATKLAMLADIIPIVVFIHTAFCVMLYRVFGLPLKLAIPLIIGFLGLNIAVKFSPFAGLLNGSVQYVPTLILLGIIAVITYANKRPGAADFIIATFAMLLSLTFRSIDNALCEMFPLGTHFLWHLLNPIAMYMVIRGIIKSQTKLDILT